MTSGLLKEYGREWLASSMWCCEGKSFSPKAKSTEIEIREREATTPLKIFTPAGVAPGQKTIAKDLATARLLSFIARVHLQQGRGEPKTLLLGRAIRNDADSRCRAKQADVPA